MQAEVIDQALHILWGAGIVCVAMNFGMRSAFAAIVLPIMALLPRELVDQFDGWWYIGDGKMLDITCYGIGGYLAHLYWRVLYGNTKGLDSIHRQG